MDMEIAISIPFSHFIDLLVDIKIKNNKKKLFIIDPWSKDNKIINFMYHDNDLYQLIKKKEQTLNNKMIEKIYHHNHP
ncbi:MAG: hypothetical protein ACL7BU_16355 [Candidatus Phlomobacter fragariae]